MPSKLIDNDDIETLFSELTSFKDQLAKTNQPLVPILIKLFGEFRKQLLDDINSSIKTNTEQIIASKNNEINQLKEKVASYEKEKKQMWKSMDDADQYERKDSVILSGKAVPDMTPNENTHELVQHLLKQHLDVEITKYDINTTHRLGPIKNGEINSNKRNIYIKFVRRDVKKEVIAKSKQKKSPLRAFESLTPLRRKLLGILSSMKKKSPELVKGCTTLEGKVFAFTPPASGMTRDTRHYIPDMETLRSFCRAHIQLPLDEFLNATSN